MFVRDFNLKQSIYIEKLQYKHRFNNEFKLITHISAEKSLPMLYELLLKFIV